MNNEQLTISIVLTCDADPVSVLLLVFGEVAVAGGAGGARPIVLGGGREAQRGHRHQRGRRLVLLQEEAAWTWWRLRVKHSHLGER